jgi:hypothetical protein
MIVREYHSERFDGVKLYRTYSDTNHYIRQVETGVVYSEAIDVETAPYTYEETEEAIPTEKEKETEE